MGLIGGFKAKFRRNDKQKDSAVQVVIPLQYRVKAEFDSQLPPGAVPIGIRPALRKPRAPVRPDSFANTSKVVSDKLKSTYKPNVSNKSLGSGISTQEKAVKSNTGNGSDNMMNNREHSSINNYEIASNANGNKTDISENSDSTLILMTQGSDQPLTSKKKAASLRFQPEPEVIDYFPTNQEEFKDQDEFYASEDEYSQDKLNMSQYPRLSYSSNATTIFFGESEPIDSRPRRVQLRNEEDEEENDC